MTSRNLTDESGQSLVLTAVLMTAFIAMLGLVIDVGYGFAKYRQMQTAADVASLAGVRALADGAGDAAALSIMQNLLEANGADVVASQITIVDDDKANVVARTTLTPFFTPLFGLNQISLSAQSEAVYGQANAVSNVLPFAVSEDLWTLEQEVNIWVGRTGPGNYGWVRWPGQSLSTTVLRWNIDQLSNSGTLRIGQQIAGKPGVSFGAVRTSLEAKIGQTVNVFFYDPESVTGSGANLRYTVTGFGRFYITAIRSRGARSEIRGYFVDDILLGGEIRPGRSLGLLATGLTR